MTSQPLKDRVVLITGAASGIGKATAEACVAAGVRGLVLADINMHGLEQLRIELLNTTLVSTPMLKIIVQSINVECEDQVQLMLDVTVKTFGRLDAAFNNAGIESKRAPIYNSDPGDFDRVMSVNAKGVYLCMKYELEQFMCQRKAENKQDNEKIPAIGVEQAAAKKPKVMDDSDDTKKQPTSYAIVNCASTAGLRGMTEFSAYCASKHAIVGLTKSAALEHAEDGIRVNALCPSTTDTPMVQRFQSQWPDWQATQNASIPAGRVGTPHEMANAVVWMLSDQCTFMTGHCLCVDGGGMC